MYEEFKFIDKRADKTSYSARKIIIVMKCSRVRFRYDETTALVTLNLNNDCLFANGLAST